MPRKTSRSPLRSPRASRSRRARRSGRTRRSLGIVVTLLLAALSCVGLTPSPAGAAGGTFRDPLGPSPDPYMTYYQGDYYLAGTEGDAVRIAKAPTLGKLLTAPRTTVWRDPDASRNQQVWAPSFYLIDGHWYL